MSHPAVFRPLQSRFLTIPQTPLCYWLRERFFDLLTNPYRLRDAADVRQGMASADDARFTRRFWEVQSFGTVSNSTAHSGRWFWFAKGGRYQKWAALSGWWWTGKVED